MTTVDWDETHGELRFQTELIAGTLRADGQHAAITELTYRPTGTRVDSGMMFAPYRLLARSAWMGEAREMPHRAMPDGEGVEIVWPPTIGHQVELRLRIGFAEPGTVDCAVEVTGYGHYPDYEFFLSAYFARGFRPGAWLAPVRGQGTEPELVRPEANPIFREMYLSFPRDERAAAILADGRWQRGRHHTRFLPARYYGLPLGLYARDDGPLDVLLMGHPEDVFAVSMAYATDDPTDDVGQHNSLYLSLFGRDLHPGDRWRTATRLVFDDLDRDPSRHREAYDAFLTTTDRGELALD